MLDWLLVTNCILYAQILPDDPEKKPQGKQLQARSDYLLKMLKKEADCKDVTKEEVRKDMAALFNRTSLK